MSVRDDLLALFDKLSDARVLAESFCALDDEQQAQFFIEVAVIAHAWTGTLGADWQFYKVGNHLRDCACATEEARDIVRAIAAGIAEPKQQPAPAVGGEP